jgi:glycosyltransferase involved in cell wall biosynthesis
MDRSVFRCLPAGREAGEEEAMRVLFLTNGFHMGPSPRFRVHQYLPYLRENGMECEVCPPLRPEQMQRWQVKQGKGSQLMLILCQVANRLRDIKRARRFDVVFVQRGLTLFDFKGLDGPLFAQHRPVVFDFDDSVHLRPMHRFRYRLLRGLQDAGQVRRIITKSRSVIAGNAYLAEFARRHNANVSIIPTSVDTDTHRPKSATVDAGCQPADGGVVVWTGSVSTNPYANQLAPILRRVVKRVPLRLLVISSTPNRIERGGFDGVPLEFRPWQLETEVTDLQGGDIGVMPLLDDEWTRGKCGLKALLCMACGLPVVVSPVGVNTEIVTDDVNGFLAGSEDEWVDKLCRLASDGDLRRRLGKAARETVEERYSVRVNAPKFLGVLEHCA